ncbi:Hypothetical protein A7982_02179 [Minicystis rosea]|nr:Hypothetical protein A7982_02179 [Minicystis rosea]
MIRRTPHGLKRADLSRLGRRRMLGQLALGGAGALLGLPFFESLLGSDARADDTAPLRMLAFYVPCGIHMAKFTPTKKGYFYDLPPILASLAPIRPKVSVITGLANNPAFPDGSGDHASGTGAFLTVAHPKKTEAADIQNGISVDQVAANALKSKTAIASMQLGIDGGSGVGNCDSGYSCAYAHNISWASPTQPLQCLTSPSLVWDQLFAGFDPTQTATEKARQMLYRTSILDYVNDDATTLKTQLGKTDQVKLDQYLTGVSELEAKIKKSAEGPMCNPIAKPDDPPSYAQTVDLMTDLMALAFQCDATRVISFMLGNAGSNRVYDFLGISKGHHEASHHMSLEENFDILTKIDTWEVAQFAKLCQKLDAINDVNGKSVLDNSLVYFGSEIEDGNTHSHRNMPILLAGAAGGAISPGRHLVYDASVSVAQLYVSMLNAMGVQTTSFGDATSPLPDL